MGIRLRCSSYAGPAAEPSQRTGASPSSGSGSATSSSTRSFAPTLVQCGSIRGIAKVFGVKPGRKYDQRTPAMAQGLRNHIWTWEEVLRWRRRSLST
ncbi:hypothetical protein KEJ36_02400 [Candidatus Bathyarchaeota archaeon]|nr:hypothetical protein [Candidatus Bathyarchaeota archaeon]